MRPTLAAVAAEQHGVVLCRQALQHGYDPKEIRRLVRRNVWVRVRHGVYAEAGPLRAADARLRHLTTLQACLLVVADDTLASHDSAAVAHELPTWGLDLSEVALTRPRGRSSRREAGVVHHLAEVPPRHHARAAGIAATSLGRTALDVARLRGFEAGVVCADAALRAGATAGELAEAAELMAEWPGGRESTAVAAVADGRCESPGETLARLIVRGCGLSVTPQVVVPGARARVDLMLDDAPVVVEFDGRLKYVDADGRPDPQALWDEKRREDRLRDLGYEVVRITWSGLFDAGRVETERRLRAAVARASLRPRVA